MEGNGSVRGWGSYYDTHNGMKPSLVGSREAELIARMNGGFSRDYGLHSTYQHTNFNPYITDTKFYDMFPTPHSSFGVSTDTMHTLQQHEISNEEKMAPPEPSALEINSGPLKKRSAGKSEKPPKLKKLKKASSGPKDWGSGSTHRAKSAKKTTEVVINGIDMDISSIPIPVCSCTGAPQQCYRWGFGGWQSACCTTGMSMYPLPMSTKRRGARIAGRKMSLGAFKKVLEKLAAEGYNFSNPIDLRTHWAKHGTNKFVTIR